MSGATCKTCRHWIRHMLWNEDNFRSCAKSVDDAEQSIAESMQAMFCECVDESNSIITGRDFGCVHHEPSLKQEPPCPPK